MRIVQIVTRRQRRGAEVFASQIADSLVERGHEISVVGLYGCGDDALVPNLAASYDLASTSSSRLSRVRLQELQHLILQLRPDLVQANGSDTLKYSALAKRGLGASWPLVYRNISIASQWLRYPGQRAWGRWLMRQVDHVAAVSEQSRVDFAATYSVPAERIGTIPIGTEIPARLDRGAGRQRMLSEARLPADAEVLLHIGSMSPEKNHLWMLDAFAWIRASRPSTYLVLVGDGTLRDAICTRIQALGLDGAVRLLGTRPNAAELTAGADLLLLPSRVEGIPGVILEAAAHGTPCAATDVGSIHEAVQSGRTGILVPPDDMNSFVNAVTGLLSNPSVRIEMGLAAREYVRERYDMTRIVDAFEELYGRLAHQRAVTAV